MPKDLPSLQSVVLAALDDLKAIDVKVLDVSRLTTITSVMVVATGTSNRHVRALAAAAGEAAKRAGFTVLGVEGDSDAEWMLVDLVDVVVHVMSPQTRELYRLEDLWSALPRRPKAEQAGDSA
jgi:ribosome-associated protein